MKRTHGPQERAHNLLLQWGSSVAVDTHGIGFPPAPMEPTVQGGQPASTTPEAYANRALHHGVLHSAWEHLNRESRRLATTLWRCYVEGKMESQPDLREAREAFLRHHDDLCALRETAGD